MAKFDVAVMGSCMIDLVCYAARLPGPGETITGDSFAIGQGGKGANQCVAAAKLGASTALIARLGDDSFGKEYLSILQSHTVNTEEVYLVPGATSGMAQITVSQSGENQIVVVGGANNSLKFTKEIGQVLLRSKVALFQFETPLESTVEALRFLKKSNEGPTTIVNGAPANPNLDPSFLSLCDIFCVNESEAEVFLGEAVKTVDDALKGAERLRVMGARGVVITLGGSGTVVGGPGTWPPVHVPVKQVTPVDTTGAGDAFLGAFAYFLSRQRNLPLPDLAKKANEVAAASVLKKGTQSSFPTPHELPHLFS